MISWLNNGHLIHHFEHLADQQHRPFCACLLLAGLSSVSVCFPWRIWCLKKIRYPAVCIDGVVMHCPGFEGGSHLVVFLIISFFLIDIKAVMQEKYPGVYIMFIV
jgi:hypothetical protein